MICHLWFGFCRWIFMWMKFKYIYCDIDLDIYTAEKTLAVQSECEPSTQSIICTYATFLKESRNTRCSTFFLRTFSFWYTFISSINIFYKVKYFKYLQVFSNIECSVISNKICAMFIQGQLAILHFRHWALPASAASNYLLQMSRLPDQIADQNCWEIQKTWKRQLPAHDQT